jgi:putative adhesin/cell wall-active antibiotic response 4TMS protein YvqF
MANSLPPRKSLFPGLALLFVGLLLLVHNYRGLDISHLLGHWWPLLIIFWGAIKLYERAAASRSGQPTSSAISGGEIFLVLGLLSLLGMVAAYDIGKNRLHIDEWPGRGGEKFDFDLNVEPKSVLADSRISIRNVRGDISVRAGDESQIRVDGKKNIKAWSETDAEHIASAISVEIVKNGDGYEIRPVNASSGDSRVGLNLEISVPKKASLTIRNERGDVSVSDMDKSVIVSTTRGDVEVRDTTGDVTIDTGKGDIKVSDTKGNVKISGHGGEVNISSASGGLTIDGEFYGPIRADKIAKGVRFVSQRTDLTLTQLSGHMETGSGNLEIADAPGNLTLRTNSYDISIENAVGKVKVDNRNGNVEVRFSLPPKEDVDITNSSSPITISLPESSSFDIVADCHSCDINSEFSADSLKRTSTGGDSHLDGKYGKGRSPKIILKTSYGSISIRKTS